MFDPLPSQRLKIPFAKIATVLATTAGIGFGLCTVGLIAGGGRWQGLATAGAVCGGIVMLSIIGLIILGIAYVISLIFGGND